MKLSEAKQWAELLARAAKGETLQYIFHGSVWVDLPKTTTHITTDEVNDYRIKPTPTLRPWTPEEVPVGAIFRNIATRNIYLCVGVMMAGSQPVLLEHGNSYSLNSVLKCYEHSLDHGKTWLPCGVME